MQELAAMGSALQAPNWQARLLSSLRLIHLRGAYEEVFDRADAGRSSCGIHLAILVEPYLSLVLEGRKTIESRFGMNRHAPFEQVHRGDVIVLKRSSGPVEGLCIVSDVWFYRLNPDTWPDIERYANALCMDDSIFWKQKQSASYATLMRIEQVVKVPSIDVGKADPRGWVVLRNGSPRGQECLF
jgi:hypothetical protein